MPPDGYTFHGIPIDWVPSLDDTNIAARRDRVRLDQLCHLHTKQPGFAIGRAICNATDDEVSAVLQQVDSMARR